MRLNARIITDKIEQTKKFYAENLNFKIIWEDNWFILLSTPNGENSISFLAPNHLQAPKNFKTLFNGEGIFISIEVEDVDLYHKEIKKKEIDLILDIKDEE